MPNNLTFRKLDKHEVALYHNMRLECLQHYPENFGALYEEERNRKVLKFDTTISEGSPTDFLMAAFRYEEIIGICGFKQGQGLKLQHSGELSQMYIKPAFGGEGIGRQLLKTVIEMAFENPLLEQIILGVMEKNKGAQSLYRKLGFKEYGRLGNYFKSEPESATQIFMVLTLEDYNNGNR